MSLRELLKALTYHVMDRFDLTILRQNYYSPVVFPRYIQHDLSAPRRLPGMDFNTAGQLALIRRFNYCEELLSIPTEKGDIDSAAYHNNAFESGDAEMLY